MEQEYIILQIQEDDYGCEERSAGAKKTVLVRLKGIDEGDLVVLTENHLYKKMEER